MPVEQRCGCYNADMVFWLVWLLFWVHEFADKYRKDKKIIVKSEERRAWGLGLRAWSLGLGA